MFAVWRNPGSALWLGCCFLWLACPGSLAAEKPALVLDPGTVTLYVSAFDSSGRHAAGLSKDRFNVFESGVPQTIEDFKEATPSNRAAEQRRYFLIHFDENLDFRQLFRARRALQWLIGSLDASRDRLAVSRHGRLSSFSRNSIAMGRLSAYFGSDSAQFHLPPELGDKGLPSPDSEGSGRPVAPEAPRQSAPKAENMLEEGASGNVVSLSGRLKHVAGRKILLHFGRTLPSRSIQTRKRDDRFTIRILNDANVSIFVVDPATVAPPREVSGRIAALARATGGDFLPAPDIQGAMRKVLEATSYYYRLRYRANRPRDSRYRQVTVTATGTDVVLRYRSGYFATSGEGGDLTDRTVSTVLHSPRLYSDFPVALAATKSDPTTLELKVTFPFSSIRLEETSATAEGDSSYFQNLYLFVGVYDRSEQLLASLQKGYSLELSSSQLQELGPQNAAIEETVTRETLSRAAFLRAVIIVGQNLQISTGDFAL
ncbi:MAG: VWA domain-containing protein [Acidobacteriota bacterium]